MLKTDIQTRWMIKADYETVLDIERQSFADPWTLDDMLQALRQRNCIGVVAEANDVVVGYMIYELHKRNITILNMAVEPELRRMGIGKQMIDRMKDKLSQQRRTALYADIGDDNLTGQLFFAAQGFRAIQIVREQYQRDAYRFRWTLCDAEEF